jgi:tetratricopeptide (TPR) repeat protein
MVGALFLTFSDTYWTNATEAEVYAMSNAFMGFMTWLAIKWGDLPKTPRSTSLIYLIFYLLALSAGFHLGTVLVFSGIFFFVLMSKDRPFSTGEWLVATTAVAIFVADATIYRNGKLTVFFLAVLALALLWLYSKRSPFAAVCTGLFVLGVSVHLMLLIRSMHNPAIDEGDPQTWQNLYAVLRREQYPPTGVVHRKATWAFQFQHFNGYLQAQFQMFAAYVGRLNLGSILPIGLGVWGIVDQFAKHRKTFVMLFTTLMVTSIGLVAFLNFSDSEVRERDYFYSSAFYYFAIYIGIGSTSVLSEFRNAIGRAGNPVRATAAVCVVAVLLPFATLRQHFFTHDRSRNHTCSEYARNMLVCLEPNAILFTNGDNDTFPLWYIQEVEGFRKDVRVVNLSLLNTPWYIEQCRDNEPKVPISWTDEQVNALEPVPAKSGWLLVRDLAVDHILRTNRFQRPIYFAVTIPSSTFAPYQDILEMEGLAYKVVPRRGKNMINVPRLEDCIVHEYTYGGLLTADWKRDHSISIPYYTEHLIQNYAAAFVQLAYEKHRAGDNAAALTYMKVADQISPQLEPPRQLLGMYYLEAGDTSTAVQYYLDKLHQDPADSQLMYRLASVYERIGEYGKALDMIEPIMRQEPDAKDLLVMAFTLSARANQAERARGYLTDYLARHPGDEEVKEMLADFDRQLEPTPGRK